MLIIFSIQKGFEPRGTDISIRLASWMKLQQNTGPGKSLSPVPWQLTDATTARFFCDSDSKRARNTKLYDHET